MGSGTSRNDPCPCGSGRKHKKCCGARPPREGAPLSDRIAIYAIQATGLKDLQTAWEEHGETGSVRRPEAGRFGLFLDWLISGRRKGGVTLLERFEADFGAVLSEKERGELEAHKATRLGVYEVIALRPGKGLRFKDLFSAEEFEVGDKSSSREAVIHDILVARVRWSDDPPSLWGEAVLFGPLEREELKFDLRVAYEEAKVHEPTLSWQAFLNSALPILKRLQAHYLVKGGTSVSVEPGPTRRSQAAAVAAAVRGHAETWPQTPIPALGGRTPLQAAADPEGRTFLADLLKEYERNASRERNGLSTCMNAPAIDWMRKALGLPPKTQPFP